MALEVIFKLSPTLCVVAKGWRLDLCDVLDGNEKIVGLMSWV